MDLESAVDQFSDAAEQPHGPFRHHMAPLKPEVDQVADEVEAVP